MGEGQPDDERAASCGAVIKHVGLDLQIVLCVLATALLLAIGAGVFSSWALSHPGLTSSLVVNGNPVYTGFLTYWSYIILLSPAMPITLYITLVYSTVPSQRQAAVCLCVSRLTVCVSAGLR